MVAASPFPLLEAFSLLNLLSIPSFVASLFRILLVFSAAFSSSHTGSEFATHC